jgi:tight adherence protein C
MVQLSSFTGWAVLCGIGLGVGLWSLAGLIPRLSRPRLVHRVAPYLVDVSAGAREFRDRRGVEPVSAFGALLGPAFERARGLLGRALGGAETVRMRLRQAGSALTVEEFRSRQLGWTLGGAAVGVVAAVVAGRLQPVLVVLQVLIVIVGAATGLIGCDYLLQRAARARIARMTDELPTVLEFLTLSLSAGEGILDAIRRVGGTSHGELAGEFAGVLAAVNTGLPFGDSLTRMADAVRLAPLSRVVDQITGALERGTPLADVLRAQAQDARDEAKRQLLESAGKKEVAMLFPLVFLILPVTIVFAIFPGVVALQLGV